MREIILNFPKQFEFEPKVHNIRALLNFKQFVVCGMGGSHLVADLFKIYNPSLNLIIHQNYSLPNSISKQSLIIIVSHSGSTEEALDNYKITRNKKLNLAIITQGGELLQLAQKDKVAYIQIPQSNIPARSALGFTLKALLKIIKLEKASNQLEQVSKLLRAEDFEKPGKNLAKELKNFTPIIYSSEKNKAIAYNWKIKFNENSKVPAFYNVFPELNHNEMAGFDVKPQTKALSQNFYFIFLKDSKDHPRIIKRMQISEKILKAKNFKIKIFELKGVNIFYKIFSSLILADWASYYLAQEYHIDPLSTPMVQEFKNMLK